MSMVVTLLGALYTIATLLLPAAKIGNPGAPKVFPLMLGIALLLFGILLVLEEIRKFPKTDEEKAKAKKSLEFGSAEKNIVWTIINGVLYALLFDRIGYVFSTFIFLGLELIIFRGKKGWVKSLIIALIFSVVAFLLFNTALGIFLPTSFLKFV
jgi:putative tricarboxylic transport membrane protein